MRRFRAWVAVAAALLVSKSLAGDNYLADRIDRKPAAKHRNSALSGGHKALAWQGNDEKVGQLRGSITAAETTSTTPYGSKTQPPSTYTPVSRRIEPNPVADGIKQGEVSAVMVPWDSVTSTTSRYYSAATSSGPPSESTISKSNEQQRTGRLPGFISKVDTAGQVEEPNYNQNAPTKVDAPADSNKYSPASMPNPLPAEIDSTLPRADEVGRAVGVVGVFVPWSGGASTPASYGRTGVPGRRGDEISNDYFPRQYNYGGTSDEKWSDRRKAIDNTHQRDSSDKNMDKLNEGQKWTESKAGKPAGALDGMNAASYKQDAIDKNVRPLSTKSQYGEQRSVPYIDKASLPTNKQVNSVPNSGSDEATHEGNAATVDVSWETRAFKSSGYSSAKASASESDHHEMTDVYDGALGPITPWNDGRPQLVKEYTTKKSTQTQGYGHLLGDVIPWNEASLLFARGLQSEPENLQTSEVRVEKTIDEPSVHGGSKDEEDGVMTTMTVSDENVRWNQDDCQPCEVPTQPPTLAPPYPRDNDDYEKRLPTIIDENESWEDLKENLPSSSPTNTPEEKPHNGEFVHCTKIVGDYGERYECTTESATPALTKAPTDNACIDVSVEGDATYCIQGPICSGSGSNPTGSLCPVKGDVAVKDCNSDKLPSWTSGICVAPADASCFKIKTGAWGCVYDEANNTTTNSTESATPAPTKVPTDKTCIDVSVEGDVTYCIQGPICSGSGSNPTGSLCPVKGDVAVKDCISDKLPSWTSTGACVAPADATCTKIKTGVWVCVYGKASNTTTNSNGESDTPTQTPMETSSNLPTETPTVAPYESTSYPIEPETTTPERNEPTPAPSKPNEDESTSTPSNPNEPNEPTPTPSKPSGPDDESTPAPTKPSEPGYESTPAPSEPGKPDESSPAPSKPNGPSDSTPAPSKPNEPDEPTPAPSQPSEATPAPTNPYDEATPAPTNPYDEPTPTPAASITEDGISTGKTTSSSTTTKSSTSNTTAGPSSSTKTTGTPATKTSTSSEDNAYTNTGTSGADANVAGASTSTGTTSSGASGVLSGGEIAGIVIACIAFVAIIVGAVLIRQRLIARQREENLFAELSGAGGRSLETDYAAM
ncbi:hypothetical protein F442_09565 [Phytophthora nicotianae P10297]|uniref:Mucin-like domain-containing protein n=1 Tax=Phytophthora nicotianae P10297 TaxID=1317064 RepID=W2Z8R0_PHYNI|nr:hypothetical protein F442_09565 [Phytophthora nicotianae P10297]